MSVLTSPARPCRLLSRRAGGDARDTRWTRVGHRLRGIHDEVDDDLKPNAVQDWRKQRIDAHFYFHAPISLFAMDQRQADLDHLVQPGRWKLDVRRPCQSPNRQDVGIPMRAVVVFCGLLIAAACLRRRRAVGTMSDKPQGHVLPFRQFLNALAYWDCHITYNAYMIAAPIPVYEGLVRSNLRIDLQPAEHRSRTKLGEQAT